LMQAWDKRSGQTCPPAQSLGKITAATRNMWVHALEKEAAAPDQGQEALLRLEMAAELPTPPAHLEQRRALQLKLLTRRNDPAPNQTWKDDVAKVLASSHAPESSRRLTAALKVLLRR
jgi:ATP-dependent RNA helicase SUPV3L1/SUV3